MGSKEKAQNIVMGGTGHHSGEGIGVSEGISGGLGNLPWGCRHWGRVLGHLKGPTFQDLPTHIVGISLRGGGDGGGRALPLPLPNHINRPLGCLSTKFQIMFGAPALPHWMGGEEDP